MKKIIFALSAAIVALSSCSIKDEWGPVFSGNENPDPYTTVIMNRTITIAELCAKYKQGEPWLMTGNHVIEGKVISTDQPGNFYKSFYIQDETAGIEIKIGKNALYNDYKLGQTIYVKCNDLYLGMYGYSSSSYGGQGMVQIGHCDPTGQYENSYIESDLLIDTHVIRGEMGDPVKPEVITKSQLPTSGQNQAHNKYVGRLVTLENLTYKKEAFALLYPDPNKAHTKEQPENRLFLTDDTWGITTWAMSKANVIAHLKAGDWDTAEVGSGNTKFGPITTTIESEGTMFPESMGLSYKDLLIKNAAAASVTQYFDMDGKDIQLRTSGFCKFCDIEIPADVRDGSRTVNITGVLCMYQGGIQMVVNSLDDITYSDGTPLYM